MTVTARVGMVLLLLATPAAEAVEPAPELPAGWTPGPTVGRLGELATVSLSEGYIFLDAEATARFLVENQNIPDGSELATIIRTRDDDYWFAVFSYSDTGHVADDDQDEIDADSLLESMQDGSRAANEERKRRGWDALNLEGWHQPPFYDQNTRNLTWATRLSSNGQAVINHSVRLLGRTGVMAVQLVADPEQLEWATAEFNEELNGFTFVPGQRYAEFQQGDKLAGYGLTALIAGGAAAAAVKTGFFKKAGKLLIFAALALVAALRKLFSMLFGSKSDVADPAPAGGGDAR